MGSRGPVPKRSEERMGHLTKAEKASISRPAPGEAPTTDVVWPEPDPFWHPIATDWYLSLRESGQAAYYQQSDVATARFVAEGMHRNLDNPRFSAQLFAAVMGGMSNLLVTEGDRRRVRIELERRRAPQTPEQPAGVTAIADYRAAMEG